MLHISRVAIIVGWVDARKPNQEKPLGWLGFAFSGELSHFRPSIVSLNPTYEAVYIGN